MKKFGFTLPEVIITLGIIGVVAAITTSALLRNSDSAKIGPYLAKFVTSVETAAGKVMYKENENLISDVAATADELGEKLSQYMPLTPVNANYKIYVPDGSKEFGNFDTSTTASPYFMQMKDGSVLVIISTSGIGITKKNDYQGILKDPKFIIYYDINGTKGKNSAGKDVYFFILDDTGVLVPGGSKVYSEAYDSNNSDLQLTSCSKTASDAGAGFACTGEIADNGWKVKKERN